MISAFQHYVYSMIIYKNIISNVTKHILYTGPTPAILTLSASHVLVIRIMISSAFIPCCSSMFSLSHMSIVGQLGERVVLADLLTHNYGHVY